MYNHNSTTKKKNQVVILSKKKKNNLKKDTNYPSRLILDLTKSIPQSGGVA